MNEHNQQDTSADTMDLSLIHPRLLEHDRNPKKDFPVAATAFPKFPNLPTELRLKIVRTLLHSHLCGLRLKLPQNVVQIPTQLC